MRHLLIVTCVFLCLPYSFAKSRKQGPTDFQLPASFQIDFQVASAQRANLSIPKITDPEIVTTANGVFGDLVGTTMITGYGLPYRWQLSVVNDNVINAGSLPDGEIVVNGGMAKLLSSNRGLWAAVLSHEVAHTARRHAVRQYLYQEYIREQLRYYQMRAAAGDKSANWAIIGLSVSAPVAEKKLSRDLEHDADNTGMMLMARAGYHPDNVFALHHLLKAKTGEQSKFVAFFSTHPRWETRDQRDEKTYSDALAEYTRLWPDALKSPGGLPPSVAFLGKAASSANKKNKTADVHVAIYCRNTVAPVTMLLTFRRNTQPVPSSESTLRDDKGNLLVREQFQCSDKDDGHPFAVAIPASAVSDQDRNIRARMAVFDANGAMLGLSDEFDVHIPKNR